MSKPITTPVFSTDGARDYFVTDYTQEELDEAARASNRRRDARDREWAARVEEAREMRRYGP